MAQQPQGRFRRFLSTTPGKVVIIVLAFLVVFATNAYVSVVVAIPAILLFGLAVPIWAGLKRPRFIALLGLVVVLTVAPVVTVVFTQEILTPVGVANSSNTLSASNGQPVMKNATVHPFTGTTSTVFTWTVMIYPQNHPVGNTTPYSLYLYISSCPGATGNNSPYCTQPYTLIVLNQSLNSSATSPYPATFQEKIGSNGVWEWQMGVYTKNSTTGVPYFQLLVGDPTYNGIEGPVIGGFGTIYGDLLPSVYFQDILFLAAPFYFVLLIYMLFKNRERRRQEAQQRAPTLVPQEEGSAGTAPTTAKGSPLPSAQKPPGPSAGPPGSAATAPELNCPKCNAVVYAGEESCWKCGAVLPSPTSKPGQTTG